MLLSTLSRPGNVLSTHLFPATFPEQQHHNQTPVHSFDCPYFSWSAMRSQLPRTPPREAKRNPPLVSKFSTSPPRRTFTTLVKSVKDVVSKANLSGHFSKRDS